jgi:hypothetical protein
MNTMKKLLLLITLVAALQPVLHAQTTWKSPSYKAETIRKVMILAKVTDVAARRQLEDYTVQTLSDKGIQAVAAYSGLKRTHFPTREAFLAYADSIEVDALLVYSVEDSEKIAENTPTVSVGVGVGMYGGYMGASAPIAGGTKVVTMVTVSGKFYTRYTTGVQWLINLSGKLDGPTDKLAYSFARSTTKAMLKEGLFLPAKK